MKIEKDKSIQPNYAIVTINVIALRVITTPGTILYILYATEKILVELIFLIWSRM